jgi:hypothetical protein
VAADPAGHLDFRFSDSDDERRRRWKRKPPGQWHWPVILIAVVCIGAPSVPSSSRGAAGSPYRDPGTVVEGDRVLIVADNSPSMLDDSGLFIRLRDSQVASLKQRHHVVGDIVLTRGWSISAGNDQLSFLLPLEAALAERPAIDTVYFISDFALNDDRFHDPEGRVRLRELLRSRRLRLYVATVNQPVPQDYVRQAEDSGGTELIRDWRSGAQ